MENANQSLVEAGSTVQEVRKNAKCSAVLGILWKHQKCQLERLKKNTREADAIGKEAQKRPSTR